MVSPKYIHTNSSMQTEQVVFTSICVYIHIYAITISKKKRGCEFDAECGEVYGKEEGGRRNIVIRLPTVLALAIKPGLF